MQKRIFIIFIITPLCLLGCASDLENYIDQQKPDLSSETIIAMKERRVISGMTREQVRLVLGEPTFTEHRSENNRERWIYRFIKGGSNIAEVYEPYSAFPQGIAYVVPIYYNPQEIRIDFCQDKVCRVQEVLKF